MTNIPTAPQPSAPPPSVPSPGAVPPGGSAYGGQPQYPMSPEPAKRGFGVWIAVAAVIALLIGLGVGFVAAQPSKNDVTKQKNAAGPGDSAEQLDHRAEQLDRERDCPYHVLEGGDGCEGSDRPAREPVAGLLRLPGGTVWVGRGGTDPIAHERSAADHDGPA
jgi:hypothetical protein